MSKVTPFLWFDGDAEAAATLYVSLFPNSRITSVSRYSANTPGEPGAVMTVAFELDGAAWTALNGGPMYRFTEAVSFSISCDSQAEVDHYWDGLLAGGGEPGQCGWLKDRFGLSWQVVPKRLGELMGGPDRAAAGRVAQAMMKMTRLDVAALEAAALSPAD